MSSPDKINDNQNLIPYVVHGSFRKHLQEINMAIEELDDTGVAKAIAPDNCSSINERDGFVFLSGESDKDRFKIEAEYLQSVINLRALGGFSLFVATDGYIGKSAAYEYGVAQSCGVPTFFTEMPKDVPFYVDPRSIKSVEELSNALINNPDSILKTLYSVGELDDIWNNLSFPIASVAVGGIVRFQKKILLSEDGRWRNNQLTVPGTTVKARETRDCALQRALGDKFGIYMDNVSSVAPLKTSFMIENSGYDKPGMAINNLVFDDRIIDISSDNIDISKTQRLHFLSQNEVQILMRRGEIEPNANSLLNDYFTKFQV